MPEAPQVLRQVRRRPVPPVLLFLQRRHHDQVEVAPEPPGQRRRRPARRPGRRLHADHPLDLGRRPALEVVGPAAGEDLVEQHAERVDVGGAADRGAADLLGRGELRGHDQEPRPREILALRPADQLGDAEVEQLRLAAGGDEDVGGLEVAVDHEVLVRVGHRVAHGGKQLQPLVQRQVVGLAVAVDRLALDQLHREVGQALLGDPAVHQPRDPRVLQQRQDPPLLDEAPEHAGPALMDHLDRDPLLELPVVPLAEQAPGPSRRAPARGPRGTGRSARESARRSPPRRRAAARRAGRQVSRARCPSGGRPASAPALRPAGSRRRRSPAR